MVDVFIPTELERFEGKIRGNCPGGRPQVWPVNGTPKRCDPGDKILFSDGDRVRAKGVILEVKEDQIEFTPLVEVDEPNPVEPFDHPGFKYVEEENIDNLKS